MKLTIFFLTLLYSFSSFATASSCYHTSLGLYHFDNVAFGKKVESVMVRTAALQRYRYEVFGDPNYWYNINESEMINNGSNFFAKVKVVGFSGSHAMSQFQNIVVQYLVRFEDGSSMFTAPVIVPVSKKVNVDFDPNVNSEQNAIDAFEKTQNVDKTKTTIIKDCWVS